MDKIRKLTKALGIYQILGGLMGLILGTYYTVKADVFTVSIFKLTILFLLLYSFSIYCGFLLLNKNYEKGLNLSIINQILQIISFSVLGFTFQYTSGAFLYFGLNLTTDTLLTYNLGLTTFNFKWSSDSQTAAFSINIISLILINILFNLKEKIRKENKSDLSEIEPNKTI